ncbi:unnamed protein product [Closterium sp. NIES-53]
MYALSFSAEGDCYRYVLPDPGIAAAALGASASSTPPGTAPAEALHTFTLDSGASRCFFRDSTTLTPLPAPVPVRLADPSGGPVVPNSSTVLPCPAVPSGSLSGLHLPSFSTNLVSTAALQDAMVTTTTSGGQRVSICTCTWMGRHLATLFFGTTARVTPPCHDFVACTPVSLSLVSPGLCFPCRPHLPRLGPARAIPCPQGVEPGGAESEGAESGSAEPRGAALSGGPAGASSRLSSQQLREWLVQRPHRRSGAPRAGELGDAGAGGAAITTGAGDPMGSGAAGAGVAGAGVAGVGGPGAGGAGAAGAGAVDPGAGGAGGTVRPRPYYVPLRQQVLGVPFSPGLPPPFLCQPPDQSQPPLQPASQLPVPSPYSEQSGGLTERHEPATRPVSPVRTARRAPRLRPPPVPGTHTMALRPSSVPLRVPLPAPPGSCLPEVLDPELDRAHVASPTVARLLATVVTDPFFESAAASTLIAELLDFAAAYRLDYASDVVAESVPASPRRRRRRPDELGQWQQSTG